VEQNGLLGGVCYYDGQFDDARLAINLAQTVFDQGGTALNYLKIIALIKQNGLVIGARLQDTLSGEEHEVFAKAVINATGVFCDNIRKLDDPEAKTIIAPSQGAHIVLPKAFLPGDSAIMVPHTPDGRVLFAVPWHDRVIVGTTDIAVETTTLEPSPMEEEIDFILTTSAKYLHRAPLRSDVLSVFAGLRPLVKAGDGKNSAALSRDHTILISESGLLTITGGKWTTYRKMAEDVIDQAETVAGFERRPCRTETLPIHGAPSVPFSPSLYGTDAPAMTNLASGDSTLNEPLHPNLPYTKTEIVWAVREEMAQTVEDVLARRTRALLLDANASIDVAPKVAHCMAQESGQDVAWEQASVDAFRAVAERYQLR
jgi:glycerol-3-phosphate dehydrogenase